MLPLSSHLVKFHIDAMVDECHERARSAGWWSEVDPSDKYHIATKLCLIHSEISEALEGVRKDKQDDHLPAFSSFEVELADALIRIFDLAGGSELRLGAALAAKLEYNAQWADHKPENRSAAGGKKI